MSLPDHLLKGSEARLWELVEERTKPGADVAAIDQRIWDLFGEQWSVMFTDLSGFSRRAADFGILHFLQVILEKKKLLLPIVHAHDGILLKVEADSFLLIFRRPARALACAIAMQRACQQASERRVDAEKIVLCLGIGFGPVLRIGDTDVFGEEVNAASKLGEDIAEPHEVLITGATRDILGEVPGVRFEPLDVEVPGSDRTFRVHYR